MTWPADFLVDEPEGPAVGTFVLGHGAGAGMEHGEMVAWAAAFAATGLRVVRFEFPYMAARREGRRLPPPEASTQVPFYEQTLATVLSLTEGPVLIGGKSMGGRIATMVAGRMDLDARVKAVAIVGYPFHPPDSPAQLRLAPLLACRLPVLILQGTRDPYGSAVEVAGYSLPAGVTTVWFEDGDHSLVPPKASTRKVEDHRRAAAERARALLP